MWMCNLLAHFCRLLCCLDWTIKWPNWFWLVFAAGSIAAMLLLSSTNEFANIFAYYAFSWVRGRCSGLDRQANCQTSHAFVSAGSACQVRVTGQRSSPTHWQCHCYLNCSSFFNPPKDMSWLIRQLLSRHCFLFKCYCVFACKWRLSTESCQSMPTGRSAIRLAHNCRHRLMLYSALVAFVWLVKLIRHICTSESALCLRNSTWRVPQSIVLPENVHARIVKLLCENSCILW